MEHTLFTCVSPSPSLVADGVSECGGTAEVVESLDSNSNRKCTLLIRKFNLNSEEEASSMGTNTEVSVCVCVLLVLKRTEK